MTSCQCPAPSGFHCRKCCFTFTSAGAFDRHLGTLQDGAYEHRTPEDSGLHKTPRGYSLPPSGDRGRPYGASTGVCART